MVLTILQLVLVGAQVFQSERKKHFEDRAKDLMKKIMEVEDSDFYKKDMEAKGRAERDLHLEVDSLAQEFLKESAK
jgi:cell fate (sporulation/competence/biofilm development) regulator YmcA (YheA/YmcA/DUF963 family)